MPFLALTTFRWYLLGLLLLFGLYVAYEYYKPKPLNWEPTLSNKDKIPYGTYALYDVLPEVLGSDSVQSVRLPIFTQLLGDDEPEADDSTARQADRQARHAAEVQPLVHARGTYLFVNQEFNCDQAETRALLRYVEQGNNVFIAAERWWGGQALADTLGFGVERADSSPVRELGPGASRDSTTLRLLGRQPGRRYDAFRFPGAVTNYRLALYSSSPHQGATLAADERGRPVLLRLDRGRGHLYLCSVPLALGNYWVLRPRQGQFALAALSQLPTGQPVWWDEFAKQGRVGEQSLLRVVVGSPGLRQAYYLLLLGAVLLVAGAARRRQRVIPTLRPLPNTTLLFTRTVAGLYRQGRSHALIAEKKTALFLDYLRVRFHEPAPDLGSEEFRERLSQKTGVPRAEVDSLARTINFARTAPAVSDAGLLKLSRAITAFRRAAR